METYCEQCGCRILMPEDVGRMEYVWETWGPGGRKVVRKATVICTACLEEEERLVEPFAEVEAAFDRWVKEQARQEKPHRSGVLR